MCVRERGSVCEREIEIINDANEVDVAANVDVAVVIARDAIVDFDLDDVVDDADLDAYAALAPDYIIDAAWGATPPKAH